MELTLPHSVRKLWLSSKLRKLTSSSAGGADALSSSGGNGGEAKRKGWPKGRRRPFTSGLSWLGLRAGALIVLLSWAALWAASRGELSRAFTRCGADRAA